MSIYLERALRRAGHTEVTLELLEGLGHFWKRTHLGDEHYRVVNIVMQWLVKTLRCMQPTQSMEAARSAVGWRLIPNRDAEMEIPT